ncbi:MAG: hypothetical protein WDZ44_01915 [Candidatus Spechtbacterales bacterium]
MGYGRRVALFVGVMVVVAILLIVLFVASARDAVDGARWEVQLPDIPSLEELQP